MFQLSRQAITLFGFTIQWYGILIATGILSGIVLAARRERILGLPKDTTVDLALILMPAAIVGARLYYVAFSWDYYSQNLLKIFSVREGGMAIYGSVLAGALAALVYARVKKLPLSKIVDLCAPSVALGQAVGRWGNFFNQEAYGAAVTRPGLQWFPFAVYIPADQSWHLATFFYESAWCALIVAALLLWERRGRFRRSGDVFFWYALLYALERVVVEGLRTDSLYWGSLRVSQGLSLLIALAVVLLFAYRLKKWWLTVPPAILAIALFAQVRTPLVLMLSAVTLACCMFAYFRTPCGDPHRQEAPPAQSAGGDAAP